jgi:hypothetical protein
MRLPIPFILLLSALLTFSCRPCPVKLILFETRDGYHDLQATESTPFLKYRIEVPELRNLFVEDGRMIMETFMAGVNFSDDSAVLLIEQFWNGIKVQQCLITPALKGVSGFGQGQNRALDIRTQVKRENGPLSACTLRNHSYWQTDFEGITSFGQGDEFSWGNTTVDLSEPVIVTWKYRWSIPGCHFYFDHVKVEI